jgi:hypothetical protein
MKRFPARVVKVVTDERLSTVVSGYTLKDPVSVTVFDKPSTGTQDSQSIYTCQLATWHNSLELPTYSLDSSEETWKIAAPAVSLKAAE